MLRQCLYFVDCLRYGVFQVKKYSVVLYFSVLYFSVLYLLYNSCEYIVYACMKCNSGGGDIHYVLKYTCAHKAWVLILVVFVP